MATTLELHSADVVSLIPAARAGGGQLFDPIRSSAIPVNRSAGELLDLLQEPRRMGPLIEEFAATADISAVAARRDVLATLDQLDTLYLVDVKRDWRSRLSWSALTARVTAGLALDLWRPPAWSRRGSVRAVALGVLRSAAPFVLVSVALIPLLALVLSSAGALEALGTSVLAFAFVPFLLLMLAAVQFIAHECAHYLVSKRFRASPYVVQRGSRVFVTHLGLADAPRRLVAIAGPVAGAVVAVLQAWLLRWLDLTAIEQAVLTVGALQLFSLIPVTADGRMLWRRSTAGALPVNVRPAPTGVGAPDEPGV